MLSPLRLVVRLYRLWLAGVAGYLIGSILTADLASRVANLGNDDAVLVRQDLEHTALLAAVLAGHDDHVVVLANWCL